ncbi:hypothetical protein B5F35_05775 [Anaeromassilibacillus sp. An200]|nr:hypothetical protein B5F35_05775 [Anaeromassilibacillus sp. An200]
MQFINDRRKTEMFMTVSDSTAKRGSAWNEQHTEQLIVSIAGGDTSALEELYHLTQAPLYAYLLSLLKNSADAGDALQDTYLDVFTTAARYQPQGHSRAWLYAIAKNKAMMTFRRKKIRGEVPEEESGPEPWEDPHLGREERMVLSAALNILSEEERQIVTLHAVSGFRFREVASFLELPINTVLSKYHRAMKRLRRQLSEEEGV